MTRVRPTFLLSLALLLGSCALPPGPRPTPTVVGFTSYGRFFFHDPDKFPTDLTVGPDGAVWFTERKAAIGRFTPTCLNTPVCAFPEFALPNVHSGPGAITFGPDGAFWFTDGGTNSIGRMTLTGAVTEFALRRPLTLPWAITTGPDGALWFTGPGNQIGRITPAGAIREFPMPIGGEPQDIVTGPDGALWFTEFWGPVLGRVTVSGVFAQIPLQSHTSGMQQPYDPRVITLGPDGALWFTQQADFSLWRVTPAPAPVASATATIAH